MLQLSVVLWELQLVTLKFQASSGTESSGNNSINVSACVETGKVRPPEYTPNRVVDIVRQLIELAPSSLTFS